MEANCFSFPSMARRIVLWLAQTPQEKEYIWVLFKSLRSSKLMMASPLFLFHLLKIHTHTQTHTHIHTYFKGKMTNIHVKRERDREREIPSIESLSKWLQKTIQSKGRTRNFIQASHIGCGLDIQVVRLLFIAFSDASVCIEPTVNKTLLKTH